MARRKKDRSYNPAEQAPISVRRDRAFWVGLGFGLLAVVIAWAIALFVLVKGEAMQYPASWVYAFGLCGIALAGTGVFGWMKVRKLDDENYMVQKSTPMPLKLAGEHDDIWTEGRIRCPRPLFAPKFGIRCAFYHYVEKEKRGSGKHSHWVTIADEKRFSPTWIEQGPLDVRLDMPRADFQYLQTSNSREFNRTYSLKYLPAIGRASACGVITVSQSGLKAPEKRGEMIPPKGSPAEAGDWPAGRVNKKLFDGDEDDWDVFGNKRLIRRAAKIQQKKERRATRMIPPRGSNARRRGYDSADGAEGEDLELELDEAATVDEREKRTDEAWRPAKPWLLTKMGNVPLMVTPVARNEWNDRAEAGEVHWRVGSAVGLIVGTTSMITMLGGMAGMFPMALAPWPIVVSAIIAMAILLPLLALSTYNRFVMYRVRVQNAWSQIDVDLKARHDVVPNLVEVVKAYSAYEAETMEKITAMRTQAKQATRAAQQLLRAEAAMSDLSNQLIVAIENYPDLKANTVYTNLQRQLVALEEKISHGRGFYNEVVKEYNTLVETFPNSLFAPSLGFRTMPWWQLAADEQAAREAPRVG